MHNEGIRITDVRVRNFRCLRSIDLALARRTILVGENNAGKTSLLRAIHAAIGAGQRTMTETDVYLTPTETRAPRDRAILVDILIRPATTAGELDAEFSDDGPWVAHFGGAIIQDESGHDQVAIRTRFGWDHQKGDYILSRHFLKEWSHGSDDIDDVEELFGCPLSRTHLEPLELHYIDANRDIAREMKTHGSYWRRLVSDLGVSDATVKEIEETLTAINERLISESTVLEHLEERLNDLYQVMRADQHTIALTAVEGRLHDVSRSIDARISTDGGPSFRLEDQGMGTRSLASLLALRAFVDWRANRNTREGFLSFVAIEEPESHLQPQAQRAVFQQLSVLPGQWIITTHSPYICSQADLRECRVLSKRGGETSVRQLGGSTWESPLLDEDLRKLQRQVMNTRGDMLFATVLILFEGETEEQAIPSFAERFFECHPSTLGLSLVGVGGSGNYAPFIRLAKTFGIPWRVFSDGEKDALKALDAALGKLDEASASKNPRVVVIPHDGAFEDYICSEGRDRAIIEMIVTQRAKSDKHRASLSKEWNKKSANDLADELRSEKTMYGSKVAQALAGLPLPSRIASLLEGVRDDLYATGRLSQ